MTNYEKLVEALRILQDKNSLSYYKRQVCKDAADAIEKLVTLYEKTEMDATNLTGKLAQAEADVERLNLEIDKRIATEIELSNQVDALQAEVERLKDSNEELREKQTFIDHYGTEWLTSAKDVPTAAYEHGYADGMAEVKAQLPKRGKWIEDATTYAGPGLSNYKCSLCGKICGTWRRGLEPSELPNWCGNCGADMRKMEVQE